MRDVHRNARAYRAIKNFVHSRRMRAGIGRQSVREARTRPLSPPNLNALRVIIIVKKDIGFDGPWFNRFLKRHAACEKDGLYESLKRGKQQRFWSCAATCLVDQI
jgi:hypothetical protein